MKTKLIPTQNGLRKPTRRAMIDLLNLQLADVLDLGLQAKQLLAVIVLYKALGGGWQDETKPNHPT